MARPMISVRRTGIPLGSGGAGDLRSVRRRQALILGSDTPATRPPVLGVLP
jgi:hypothetical protein